MHIRQFVLSWTANLSFSRDEQIHFARIEPLTALAVHPGLDIDIRRVQFADDDAWSQRTRLVEVLRHAELERALGFAWRPDAPITQEGHAPDQILGVGRPNVLPLLA